MKILIVEDNALLGKSLKKGLEEADWVVDLACDGEEGQYCVDSCEYDVILLDWMLPKQSGLELLKRIRASERRVPVIMATARHEVSDRVRGLTDGADDYLVKPFEFVELLARVNALHRRSITRGVEKLAIGPLTLDLASHKISLNGATMDLTAKEYDLLASLAMRQDQLVKRAALVGNLYQLDCEPDSNSLDVLLARVRKKLAGSGVEIQTVRGKGFILSVAPPST